MKPYEYEDVEGQPINGLVTVVVLNDGQTFTDIHGCTICVVPHAQYMKVVDSGGDAQDFIPVAEFSLSNVSISVENQ
jgi:hypothetical protein